MLKRPMRKVSNLAAGNAQESCWHQEKPEFFILLRVSQQRHRRRQAQPVFPRPLQPALWQVLLLLPVLLLPVLLWALQLGPPQSWLVPVPKI